MQNEKAPGNDEINIERVKAGGHGLWKALAVKFSRYLIKYHPQQLEGVEIVLLKKRCK